MSKVLNPREKMLCISLKNENSFLMIVSFGGLHHHLFADSNLQKLMKTF